MEFNPTVAISNCYGGYVVQAQVRCDCKDPECGGWKTQSSVFTDVGLMMRFVENVVLDYDSQDELRDAVESKLRK